jgi:phosphoribosylanthranilate isomerase
MMKIKICGLFREEDIDYVNEAMPDYAGFVFAQSKRQVSMELASRLRRCLAEDIVPVGVFIDAPVADIVALYRDGVIGIAQLHGGESEEYIARLKEASGDTPVPVIKVIKSPTANFTTSNLWFAEHGGIINTGADYYLLDSGAGSGKTFNWDLLNLPQSPFNKPWFLAGGINLGNIEKAMTFEPFGIDVSSGAETKDEKDREKILRLTKIVREGNKG